MKSIKIQLIVLTLLLLISAGIVISRKTYSGRPDSAVVSPSPSSAVSVSSSPAISPRPSPSSSPEPEIEELQIRRVIGNNVCLRDKADPESANLDFLYYGNAVLLIEDEGEWSRVSFGDKEGYVHSEYICPIKDYPENDGNSISEYALTMVGTKYKWGGNSPDTGFDCSGFLKYVFEHFDLPINRLASDQALNGTPVDAERMQPGDIICFKYSGKITHCAIYIGDGRVVHAANEKHGVNTAAVSDFNGAELIVRRMT